LKLAVISAGVMAWSDLVVGGVGVAVAAPVRAAEPVVHVLDLVEAEAGVERGDQRAVAIPRGAAAGGGEGADAALEGEDVVVFGAGGGGEVGVGDAVLAGGVAGPDAVDAGFEALLAEIARAIASQGERQTGGGTGATGSGGGKAGDFSGCPETITSLGDAAEIEQALEVLLAQRSGPDFDGEVRSGRDQAVGEIEVGRDGRGRLVAGGGPGQDDGGAVEGRADAADDDRRVSDAVGEGSSRCRASGRLIEGPAVDEVGVQRRAREEPENSNRGGVDSGCRHDCRVGLTSGDTRFQTTLLRRINSSVPRSPNSAVAGSGFCPSRYG
jgi:hypothetical protein